VFRVLLSVLLVLFVLMIAAHSVFIVVGVRQLLTGLPVWGRKERRDLSAEGEVRRSGLLFIVCGCVLVAAWGWLTLRAVSALIGAIP
jgi:hypothetical protein